MSGCGRTTSPTNRVAEPRPGTTGPYSGLYIYICTYMYNLYLKNQDFLTSHLRILHAAFTVCRVISVCSPFFRLLISLHFRHGTVTGMLVSFHRAAWHLIMDLHAPLFGFHGLHAIFMEGGVSRKNVDKTDRHRSFITCRTVVLRTPP